MRFHPRVTHTSFLDIPCPFAGGSCVRGQCAMSTFSKRFLLFLCASLKHETPFQLRLGYRFPLSMALPIPCFIQRRANGIAYCLLRVLVWACVSIQAENYRLLARLNSRFPISSHKWNAACVVVHLWPLSRLNLSPLLDLPCSVVVGTRRLERCRTVHAPIIGCIAVLVHSVGSGLMLGAMNKIP